MKKSTLFVILSVLGLGVVITLIVLLNSGTKTDQVIQIVKNNTVEDIMSQRIIKKETNSGWTSKITSTKEQEFLYPVTELHINLN